MKQALVYFNALADALLATQVSNHSGAALSLVLGVEHLLSSTALAQNGEKGSGKIILVGNGGSAAIASHVQNDLCKAVGVRAMVFNEPPLLTALTNDVDYASAFQHLVGLWAEPGDLLLAISSSGRSENIIRAAKTSRALGCSVATFSGFDSDNPLRRLGDLNFYVACHSYGLVELAHGALLHYITDRAMLERATIASGSQMTETNHMAHSPRRNTKENG